MADIVITLDGETGSFSLPDGAACPRVGETVCYYFTASTDDRAQFAADSLAHNDALRGREWRVTKVEHHLRRTAWNKQGCTTWVTLKRTAKRRRLDDTEKR